MNIGCWCGTFLCCIALASCTAEDPVPFRAASSSTPAFTVEVARAEDRVIYEMEGQTAVFRITSPTGMGSAQVALASGAVPDKLILRFYLQGLEKLDFAYDTTTVTASVPSSRRSPSGGGQDMVLESVRSEDGAQDEIGPDSPYWMDIRFVPAGEQTGSDGSQAGYFEVEAPDDFLTRHSRAFSIRWLDFYR